jgi:hypothetical protein
MKTLMRFIRLSIWFCYAACTLARAGSLFDVSSSLSFADSTQLGRLNRNGVISVWTATKGFPGAINTGTSYHYRTFTIPAATIALAPFLHISMDDPDSTLFISAYDTSYNAGSLSSAYLGDAGTSAGFGSPGFFEVTLPAGHDLVLVVNDVNSSSGGVGAPFHIVVDGFVDTQFTEANGLQLSSANLSGANMVFNGTNLFVSQTVYVVAATNITSPLFTWTPVWTNTIAGGTNFSFTATNVVSPNVPTRFFSVQP